MPQRPKQASQIGLIVATHGDLARSLVETGEMVLGGETDLLPFAFEAGGDPQATLRQLRALVRKADLGEGVILLVDLFGGTPGSLALSIMGDEGVEVLTGVNLPMVLAAATLSPDLTLGEACQAIVVAGSEAIKEAGAILNT